MFSKIFSIIALGAIAANAASYATTSDGTNYSCNVGSVSCCQQSHDATSVSGTNLIALVGVVAQGITGQVTAQCSPITGVGIGSGASCSSSPVCCDDNFQNQAVGVNCSPATVLA